MADLGNLENSAGVGGVRRYPGVIVSNGAGGLAVNVNGNTLPARWADPLVVAIGDPVVVDMLAGDGGSEAFVVCRTNGAPRPGTGTVKTVPPSSATITVTGTDGVDYTAYFAASYTPAVNDNVLLAWGAAQPTVTGKVGAIAPQQAVAPVIPPPAPLQTGQNPYPATDSATWVPGLGVWDGWAGGGGRVYQGNWAGYTMYGSFFYAGSPGELSGRTVTRVRFNMGSRLPIGNNNNTVSVLFYAHTSANRPGGDVTRTTGPYEVFFLPGQGPITFDLPTSFGAALLAGGGISIAGPTYAGFEGRNTQPDSGTLLLDWTR